MNKISTLLIVCFAFVACGGDKQNSQTKTMADQNPAFENYKANFIENLWKIYPGWASSQGYHKYDSVLVVPDDQSRLKELNFVKSNLDSLKTYEIKSLSDNNKTDYYMIQNQLESAEWSVNELKSWTAVGQTSR